MNMLTVLVVICVIAALVSVVWQLRAQKRDASSEYQNRDLEAQQRFEGMLQAGESLLAFCSNDTKSRYYFAVTDRRLFLETKKGVVELTQNQIRGIDFLTLNGHKLKNDRGGTMYIKIKAGKTYSVFRYSEKFEEVVSALERLGW